MTRSGPSEGGCCGARGEPRGAVQQLAYARQRGGRLKRLRELPGGSRPELQTRGVPGIELAQVARGALLAEVLDGALDRPVQLAEDLLAARLELAAAKQLLEH